MVLPLLVSLSAIDVPLFPAFSVILLTAVFCKGRCIEEGKIAESDGPDLALEWLDLKQQEQQHQQQEEDAQTKQEMNMEENETPPSEVQGDASSKSIADEDQDHQGCFSIPGLFDQVDSKGLSLLPESFRLCLLQKVFHIVVVVYDKEELDRMRRSKKWKAARQKIMDGAVTKEQGERFCSKLSRRIATTDEELRFWQSLVKDDDCLSHVLYLAKDKGVLSNDITDSSKRIPPVPFVVVMTKPLTLCFRQANFYGFQGVRAAAREREP